ncbi:hypothetical protein B0A48_04180 [Cryoendolithus antarcticus]|uniref:F-box domain-containing protein n=1 Tax=Cryoendolithus antarcticus TaxID=1507870 RepID=A0A1V8THL7_9PEZI|nr:hypothetical protein B0A48_04180 [Cryoendolithus antarcticus]
MATDVRKSYATALITPPPPTLAERNVHFNAWTASCRVLNTPELLERILINIEPIRLFPLRRTNSVFRESLDSPQLRQYLFLEHARGVVHEKSIGDINRHVQSMRSPSWHPDYHKYRYISVVSCYNPLISTWHPALHTDMLDKNGLWHDGDTEIYLDFGECAPDPGALAFGGVHVDTVTNEVVCEITNWCSMACIQCTRQARKRPVGIRNTTQARDVQHKALHPYRDKKPASWQSLKLLRVALPVRVIIRSGSRGLLFSPQRDPSMHWDYDKIRTDIVFSPAEATLGNLFAFWEKVTDEHIRVNGGAYAPLCRAMCRKWLGPGETYLDDEEWDYAKNMPRD